MREDHNAIWTIAARAEPLLVRTLISQWHSALITVNRLLWEDSGKRLGPKVAKSQDLFAIMQGDHEFAVGLYLDILRILAPYFHSSIGAGTNAKARKPNRDVAHWVCSVSSAAARNGGMHWDLHRVYCTWAWQTTGTHRRIATVSRCCPTALSLR
jgi:hypothetical protein